jgi:crossover junction endodeoxyribonuclease RusA
MGYSVEPVRGNVESLGHNGQLELTLFFLKPAEYLTMNQRKHWAWTMKQKQAWRESSRLAGLEWRPGATSRLLDGFAIVSFEFPVTQNRRRDPHNFYPTIKPIIDGLTDAGFWPDDTADFVATREPTFVMDTDYVRVKLNVINEGQ